LSADAFRQVAHAQHRIDNRLPVEFQDDRLMPARFESAFRCRDPVTPDFEQRDPVQSFFTAECDADLAGGFVDRLDAGPGNGASALIDHPAGNCASPALPRDVDGSQCQKQRHGCC